MESLPVPTAQEQGRALGITAYWHDLVRHGQPQPPDHVDLSAIEQSSVYRRALQRFGGDIPALCPAVPEFRRWLRIGYEVARLADDRGLVLRMTLRDKVPPPSGLGGARRRYGWCTEAAPRGLRVCVEAAPCDGETQYRVIDEETGCAAHDHLGTAETFPGTPEGLRRALLAAWEENIIDEDEYGSWPRFLAAGAEAEARESWQGRRPRAPGWDQRPIRTPLDPPTPNTNETPCDRCACQLAAGEGRTYYHSDWGIWVTTHATLPACHAACAAADLPPPAAD